MMRESRFLKRLLRDFVNHMDTKECSKRFEKAIENKIKRLERGGNENE